MTLQPIRCVVASSQPIREIVTSLPPVRCVVTLSQPIDCAVCLLLPIRHVVTSSDEQSVTLLPYQNQSAMWLHNHTASPLLQYRDQSAMALRHDTTNQPYCYNTETNPVPCYINQSLLAFCGYIQSIVVKHCHNQSTVAPHHCL